MTRVYVARRELLLGVAALGCLAGCKSMGLTPWKISHTSTDENGKRVTKKYEVNDWDDFTKTLAALADDFSAHAARIKEVTGELLTKLVDVPPPGQVALSDIDDRLEPYQGKERLDFVAAGAQRGGESYDFKYVQVGEPALDDFFASSARTYAVAYQQSETERRRRLLSGKLLERDVTDDTDDAVSKALESAAGAEGHDYLQALHEMGGPLNDTAVDTASAATKLASAGVRLAASAPRLIKQPKLVLHLDKIVEGISESVGLIKDSGKLMAKNNRLV